MAHESKRGFAVASAVNPGIVLAKKLLTRLPPCEHPPMRTIVYRPLFSAIAAGIFLASAAYGADTNRQHHTQFEPAIRAFEAADKTNPPPKDAVLLIGSSSIRKWTNAVAQFPKYKIINRGFGGSHLGDSVAFVERVAIPYRPRLVVLYAGDNDIAAGMSAEQVFEDFKSFVKKIRTALPETRIAFISIKPSPSRVKFSATVKAANEMIHDFIREDGHLVYVDVYTPMLTEEGEAKPELFVGDRLHMNAAGYQVWAAALRPVLDNLDAPAAQKY